MLELKKLDPESLERVKRLAIDVAKGIESYPATGPQVAGDRLATDIKNIFAVIEPE